MRGFVVTLVSMGLVLILLSMAFTLRGAQLSTDRYLTEPLPLIYGSSLIDDAGLEINSLIGPSISMEQSNESLVLMVRDVMDGDQRSERLSAYALFLEGKVADRTASTISLNLTNISSGINTLYINQELLYVNDRQSGSILLTRPGGSGAMAYEVNFTVFSLRRNATQMVFDDGGTMYARISYTDLNGTVVEEGNLSPDSQNSLKVDYPDGTSMRLILGSVAGESGSLKLESQGVYSEVSFAVTLPPLDPEIRRGFEYDAIIDYSQGPVRIIRRPGG